MNQCSQQFDTDSLREFISLTLGRDYSIADRSRAFGRRSITWRIETADGAGYYLKRHENRPHYQAELVALTEWVPRLDRSNRWSAPEVVANSPELGALILTEVPGDILEEETVGIDVSIEMYRTAGWLAAQIHRLDVDPQDAGPPRLYDRDLFQLFIERASPYVDAETLHWVERVAARDDLFFGLPQVPTHSDYSPRNWLIQRSDSGISLGLIDWERARPSYWPEDVQRMANDHWLRDPVLRHAFFEGYGRQPTTMEEQQIRLVCLANALGTVPWAIEHGDTTFAEFGRRSLNRLKSELS